MGALRLYCACGGLCEDIRDTLAVGVAGVVGMVELADSSEAGFAGLREALASVLPTVTKEIAKLAG